MLLLVVNIQVF